MGVAMTEARALRQLREDGFELLGELELGGAVVVGDPSRIGQTPANGAYHAAASERGRWLLLGRPDEEDPDTLIEVVLAHESVVTQFWAVYDEAGLAAEFPAPTGRLLVVEATRKDSASLRQSAYEPDEEGLPWLLDHAVVLAADAAHPVRVFQPAGDKVSLLALNFGEAPFVPIGRPLDAG